VKSLHGKKALVTGAASGIGRAIAISLADKGCDLYLIDHNKSSLAESAAVARRRHVNVIESCCDISQSDRVSAAVGDVLTRWNEIDILVNNAGVCYYGMSVEMSAEQWDRILAVNLLAPIQLTHELLPTLLSRPEAHILNVSSMYGLFATSRCTAYHATKFGLVGFTEALRAEYCRYGLGVTALCPGYVTSNLFRSMLTSAGKTSRQPPAWACATPEYVAQKAIRGIMRNQRLVLVTPLAYIGYYCKRFAPGVIDLLHRIGHKKQYGKSVRQPEKLPTIIPFPSRHHDSLRETTNAAA